MLPARVLVVGLGRTGHALVRALRRRGVAIRALDDRSGAPVDASGTEWVDVDVRLGAVEPAAALADVGLVVPSPGVPATAPVLQAAVAQGIPVWSEIELAARLLRRPLVAITGTNGKSTTTTLVGAALAGDGRDVFVGGNLGRPLIEAVDAAATLVVAEVSSFQLEWVDTFRPVVAAVLNVTADHLDRHPDFETYRDLKGRIFARQRGDDAAVVNRDDPAARLLGEGARGRRFSFGWSPAPGGATIDAWAVHLEIEGATERYELADTTLHGRHNAENVAAAALVARLAGASADAVRRAIVAARPLPHRLELVRDRAGVRWYDDSKATNVGAVVQSLATFDGPVVLLAGGVDKGGDYAPLAAAARDKTRLAIVIGEARDRIGAALAAAGVPVEAAPSLPAAVGRAAGVARDGDVVLLAPACSSFDMFRDYKERGCVFRAAVEELA